MASCHWFFLLSIHFAVIPTSWTEQNEETLKSRHAVICATIISWLYASLRWKTNGVIHCLISWLLDKARSHTIQDNSTFFPLTASHLKGQFLPQFMPLCMDLPLVGYLLSVALDVVKWKQKSSIKPHGDDKTTWREAVLQAAGECTRAIVIFSSNSILNL